MIEQTQDFRSNFDSRKITILVLTFLLLLSVIFISGCVQPATTIKSEREVGEAVTNISSDVDDVSQILNDIDRKLG